MTEITGGAGGLAVSILAVSVTSLHGRTRLGLLGAPELRMFNCDGELRSILRVHRNGTPAAIGDALAEGDALRLSLG